MLETDFETLPDNSCWGVESAVDRNGANIWLYRIWQNCSNLQQLLDPCFKLTYMLLQQPMLRPIPRNMFLNLQLTSTVCDVDRQQRQHDQDDEPLTETPTANADVDEDDNLWVGAFFNNILETAQPLGTVTASAVIEVQRYLEERVLDKNENPLKWWESHHQYAYPDLSKILKKNFHMVATSVPCGRISSKTELLVSLSFFCQGAAVSLFECQQSLHEKVGKHYANF